jgi:hypothetical protein
MLMVLLLAFGLRVFHLDYQSFWSDEGISLQRATLQLGEMLAGMPVEHAPGYFVGLNVWLQLTGTSDFAIRYLSLWPSVLSVALVYRLLLDLGGRRRLVAALAASLLMATGAFQVWYAQEARMYAWLLATSLIATWMLPKVLGAGFGAGMVQDARWRWGAWVAYVLSMTACVYLHHFGFLVPVAHLLFCLLWLAVTRDWRGFVRWAAAGAAVLLLYAVWLPRFLDIFGFTGWRAPQSPWALPWRYWTAYTAGDTMPEPLHRWLPWVYLALAIMGLVTWGRARRLGGLLLALSAAVPILGALALALRQPDYHERYTLMASAPIIILAAAGLFPPRQRERSLGDLGPILGALALGGLIAANALALHRLYSDAGLHKPDYRAAAQRIRDLEAPGDVILVDGPDPEKVFQHYYDGAARVVDLRYLEGKSETEVAGALVDATKGAARVWGLLYFHPPGSVQAWLARQGWPAAEAIHNGISVTLYGLPSTDDVAPLSQAPIGTDFGPQLRLMEAAMDCDGASEQDGRLSCPAGELLRATTTWDVRAQPPEYRFSLRLVDGAGRVWSAEDYTPGDGFNPSVGWPAGSTVTDQRGLLLPADLPPGDYWVTLRLYDPATGLVVESDAGPDVTLAELSVSAASRPVRSEALAIPNPMSGSARGGLALLGVGAAPQPLRSGQAGELSAWWRVDGAPTARQVEMTLTGPGGAEMRQVSSISRSPVGSWAPGQIVRERYPLTPDAAAPTGDYRLSLAALDESGAPLGQPWEAGRLAVEARPRSYTLPHMGQRVDAVFGDAMVLRGYDLMPPATPADPIGLSLYWQASDRVTSPYKVFVHLLDANGDIVAQSDAVPAAGEAPTESWLAREVVVDRHELQAPGPGTYRLVVGLYDPASGARPPAADQTGAPIPDSAVQLATITLPAE